MATNRTTKQRLSESQQSLSQQQATLNQLHQSLAAAEGRVAKAAAAASNLGTTELQVMVESLKDQLNHQVCVRCNQINMLIARLHRH